MPVAFGPLQGYSVQGAVFSLLLSSTNQSPTMSFSLESFSLSIWFLNYIKKNQGKLHVDQYADLNAAVEHNPQLDLDQVGARIILPSSFTGSTRHIQGICQDGLAVNCWAKGSDYFITMTANPHWPAIEATLLPGQRPEDCPDLICCVFHAKR